LRKAAEEELERKGKEAERHQKNAGMLEQEIDRIRKECSRALEMERFKIKKLEETLQEKGTLAVN
jgi:RNA polymerase-interacting CarD/CdnL/TRCF family regulator